MEEFKCPVCKSQYTQLNPPRLLTMCGHTFCHQCIKIFIKRKQYRYQVRCPEDKLRISIDTPTPTQFPKNMIVIEAMNKLKPKVERNQQKNEFLSGVFTQNMSTCHKNSLVASTKQSLLVSRRSSTDDGRCLIHQKPLDIICLQQKTNICAQCALFGVHKGHVCTTIKDLQLKRREWIHQIAQIMQQKKYLQQKMKQNTLFNSLNTLLEKKRQDLIAQVQKHFQHLQKIIQAQQKEMTTLIEQSLSMNENKLAKNVFVSEIREDRFQNWQKQVLDSMQYLQTDDIAKEITFFSNMVLLKDENLITKGRNIIKQMKQQQQKYWTHIKASLLYPIIKYNQKFQQQIKNVVELIDSSQSQKIPSKRTSFDDTIIHGIITPQFQQISLLDFTDNFKFKNNMSTFNDSRNESRILTDNSFLPNLDTSSDFNISPKTIKKVKSKELLTNTSLCKTNDKRDSFNSPKYRKNSDFTSKGTLPPSSPVFMKNKSKNTNFLKVKDPQKYLKIMKALEIDSLQIVDFTGFEMGDQNAKQVFQKLKNCKKVKSVRLMKNQLTDDILKEMLEVVPELQIINLSQNAFTSKAFEVLLQIAKKDRPKKVRYIQLGQNNINPRKYRQKLQQLKQLGYVVSL